jgi:hypothetical protein
MKRLIVLVSSAVVLGGCAMTFPKPPPPPKPVAKAAPAPQLYDAKGNPIERIAFRAGISTVTVEKMAAEQGCVGGQGAGLTTPPGPIEMYRMVCADNKVFVARCEYRQCKVADASQGVSTSPVVTPEASQVAEQAVVPAQAAKKPARKTKKRRSAKKK